MRNDLVSVIIPCFNAENYILATVNSVLDQTYKNIEIIVVDDCSSDNTRGVLKNLVCEEKLKFHCLDENFGGPSKARNIGIEIAKGEWVAFLDADDLWHPNKLERQLEALIDSDSKFCCTRKFDFRDRSELSSARAIGGSWEINYLTILLKDFIPTSSVVIKSEILRQMEFSESKILISVEDYDLWLRVIKSGHNCLKLQSYLTFYRISKNQISKNKFRRIRLFFLMFKDHFQCNGPMKILLAMIFTLSHYSITLLQKFLK